MANRTIIYRNVSFENNTFVILTVEVKENSKSLPLINLNHQSYSEQEKALIGEVFKNRSDVEIFKNMNYSKRFTQDYATLETLINRYNNENKEVEENKTYYTCFLRNNSAPKIDIASDIEKIEALIDLGGLEEIYTDNSKILSKDEIIQQINLFKESHDDQYYVALCPKCHAYHIFEAKNGALEGKCQVCKTLLDFRDGGFIFKHRDYAKAAQVVKEKNEANKGEKVETIIFRYNGVPYHTFNASELFALIYRNGDADVIFEINDDVIRIKKDFYNYISALDRYEARDIASELENIQSDLPSSLSFDKYAALYWLYRNFAPANKSNREDEKVVITSLGRFYNRLDFINGFIKGNKEEQLYLLSLLHDFYIDYFLDPEHQYFTSDDRTFSFSKLVYALTKKYVYISKNPDDIIIFEPDWMDHLLERSDYESTHNRYLLIKYISKDLKSFVSEDFVEKSIFYSSKIPDGYDLNCYFYMLYKNDGNYYYQDFVLPLQNEKVVNKLYKAIEDSYFYNDCKELDTFVYLTKSNILTGNSLYLVNQILNEQLREYLINENIFELYLKTKKGTPLKEVKLLYNGKKQDIYHHFMDALKTNKVYDLVKDKEINFALSQLIKDKEQVLSKAKDSFTLVNNKIEELVGGY